MLALVPPTSNRSMRFRAAAARLPLRAAVALLIGLAATAVGAAVAAASVDVRLSTALYCAAASAFTAASLVFFAVRAAERRTPSSGRLPVAWHATLELLGEQLVTHDSSQIAAIVEQAVRRSVECEHVELRRTGPGAGPERTLSGRSASAGAAPSGVAERNEQAVAVTLAGQDLATLLVTPHPAHPRFTKEEAQLLRAIAREAAVALAHAQRCSDVERRRQQQAAAWQTERMVLLETVAAEIAHEVRYSINFFRSVFRRSPRDAPLDEEEIDIGCEEVDRLERLVAGLPRLGAHRVERRAISVLELATRAETLLRDMLGGRVVEIDVRRDAVLRCDRDQITQLLVNLLANAIDATTPGDLIGVDWVPSSGGADLVVWDDGSGFEGDASRLFSPWFTTKPRGTGLGLAISQRIVRTHGWRIDAARTGERTRFVVSIPASDVLAADRRADDESSADHPSGQEDEAQ